MTNKREHTSGGVTIKVGDKASFEARDIVGGDKITMTTQVVDVEALGARLAELCDLVRKLHRAVGAAPDVEDEDARDDVVHALLGARKELAAAGDEVRALGPGEPVPAALGRRITDQLPVLAAAGKSAASLVTSVQTLANKLGPLISDLGSFFG